MRRVARLTVRQPAQQLDAAAQRCPVGCVEILGDDAGEPSLAVSPVRLERGEPV
ncbi:MAG: hypothetical protein ACR2H2_11985 [Solirubrobacteraceae bacterium]